METNPTLDPIRAHALEMATKFVSSWSGNKHAGSVMFVARGFAHYLETGEEPDWTALKEEQAA